MWASSVPTGLEDIFIFPDKQGVFSNKCYIENSLKKWPPGLRNVTTMFPPLQEQFLHTFTITLGLFSSFSHGPLNHLSLPLVDSERANRKDCRFFFSTHTFPNFYAATPFSHIFITIDHHTMFTIIYGIGIPMPAHFPNTVNTHSFGEHTGCFIF